MKYQFQFDTSLFESKHKKLVCIQISVLIHKIRQKHHSYHFSKYFQQSSFMSFWVVSKNLVIAVAKFYSIQRTVNKIIKVCSYPSYSQDLVLFNLWLFLKVKMNTQYKYFESIQEAKVGTTVLLKTCLDENFQNLLKSGKIYGTSVLNLGEVFCGLLMIM